MNNYPKQWTLAQAIDFVRQLDKLIRPVGYFAGIAGGVLIRGSSEKDLDVMIMPLNKDPIGKFNDLYKVLEAYFGPCDDQYSPIAENEYGCRFVTTELLIFRKVPGNHTGRVDVFVTKS